MGVLNVTPDSFSDGGRYATPEAAVARGRALRDGGADILDVGGESTRPGAEPVPAGEQIRRTAPVIEALVADGAIVSIDTTSAEVARAALFAGAHLVNDISAGRFDAAMLDVVADAGVPFVAMHTSARPAVMQREVRYDDVVAEVCEHLRERVEVAVARGVARDQIVLDPGLGFGKQLPHNLALLHAIPRLAALGHPVLVGTSRKSFLGHLTGRPVEERLMATAGSVAATIALGAHIVRVHDVVELRDAIVVADAIARGAAVR
ncbi:MAG: dihydropteroate synthase [Deltaproteobacteria bacterium]|nr:dihydropteroate synthase [Deltaproteobacteria bacterium]